MANLPAKRQTFEGKPGDILLQIESLPRTRQARLELLPEDDSNSLFDASPEERAKALDELAATHTHWPVLPGEA